MRSTIVILKITFSYLSLDSDCLSFNTQLKLINYFQKRSIFIVSVHNTLPGIDLSKYKPSAWNREYLIWPSVWKHFGALTIYVMTPSPVLKQCQNLSHVYLSIHCTWANRDRSKIFGFNSSSIQFLFLHHSLWGVLKSLLSPSQWSFQSVPSSLHSIRVFMK